MNVYINTKSMKDTVKAQELNNQSDKMIIDGAAIADGIYNKVLAKLK